MGASFGCAHLSDQSVWCWGRNDEGQLGYATTDVCPLDLGGGTTRAIACHTFPFQVEHLNRTSAVSAGAAFACALAVDGTVRCWGSNANGQLGNGTVITSQAPVDVTGLSNVESLALGKRHACALSSGQVSCWGANDLGELGGPTTDTCPIDGVMTGCAKTPLAVPGLSNVSAIAAGDNHTCAILIDGSVTCWGDNGWGQLGIGTAGEPPPEPPGDASDGGADASDADGDAGPMNPLRASVVTALATPLSSVLALAAGGSHTCAVRDGGDVLCWGRDDRGELGSAASGGSAGCPGACSPFATAVPGLPATVDVPDAGTDAAMDDAAPADDAGDAGDAGAFTYTGGSFGRSVTGGHAFACVRLGDGTVRCWGDNTAGQLGDGASTTSPQAPTLVIAAPGAATDNPLLGVTRVRSGESASCAVMSDASLRCWGANIAGALGVGNFSPALGPVPVSW